MENSVGHKNTTKINYMKNMDITAVNPDFIKSVTLCNEQESKKYRILHKKGETYKKFNWRKLRYEDVPFENDIIYYVDWWGDGVMEGIDKINGNDMYTVKDDKIFIRPCIDIRYKDGNLRSFYFDTYDEAFRIYTILVAEKNLVEIC